MKSNYFLFAAIWATFLLWPSSHGESKIVTVTKKPALEKRVDQLYQEIEEEISILLKQQDSLKKIK